nr:immunoglobulin heavy chain junction region [Macaca mulatta]MOY19447.1 immunoglobulin heavy chain junction region [Macaca mulatta]MOY20607.1 immunoglobulin heavy chain junction region [Macaca mulatta]
CARDVTGSGTDFW